MSADTIQLPFRCPECDASGLTPEVSEEKAIAVIRKELSLGCPKCSAIVEVTEQIGRVMWYTGIKQAQDLLREALTARLEHRAQRGKRKKRLVGQNAAANGSQPTRSETNQTSGAAGSER